MKKLAMALMAFAAFMAQGEDYTYNVASGESIVREKLSGAGAVIKTGAGTLILANGENDYTGGTGVTGGIVRVTATGAFGAGRVEVNGKDQMVELSAPKSANYNVYANDFIFTGSGNTLSSAGNADSNHSLWLGPDENTKLKLTGSIAAERNLRIRTYTTESNPEKCKGPEVLIEGALVAPGREVYVQSYGKITFAGKVTADLMFLGDVWSAGGQVYLASAENEVGEWRIGYERVYCAAANTLGGGALRYFTSGNGGHDDRSTLDLQGNDQRIACITSPAPGSGWNGPFADCGNRLCVKSTNAATLTLAGCATPATTYTTLRGAVSLVLDAEGQPDFQQNFMRHPSTMTGSITVKNGTLRLGEAATFANAVALTVEAGGTFKCESTAATAALAGVKTLKVAGVFDASLAAANPFADELDVVEITPGATIKLPPASAIRARQVKVGESVYTSCSFTQIDGVVLENAFIAATGDALTATWTGAGANNLLSAQDNWDNPFDLAIGAVRPTFAASGLSATVDCDASFLGLTFDSPGGFTLARASSPKTLTIFDDIAAIGADTGARIAYTIDTPVKIMGERKVAITGLANLYFKNALASDDAVQGPITVAGNSLVFEGANTLAGRLVTGVNRVIVKNGVLANPGRVPGERPADENAAGTIYMNLFASGGSDGNTSSGLQLQNAVVDKSLYIKNRIGSCSVYAPANTINEIRGFVRFTNNSHEKFLLQGKSETTLSGGLETDHSFRIYNGGTLRIKNKPAAFIGSAGLNPNAGTVYLDVAHNNITNLCVGYQNNNTVKVVATVDYAITNGNVQVGGNGGSFSDAVSLTSGSYTLDLCNTRQRCQRLGVMAKGVLTGEYPAMLEVTEARPQTGSFAKMGYSVAGAVTGGVGLHMNGQDGSVLLLTNRVFTSCGDLKVTGGTLELAEATWHNGTNVTVAGSGTLKLSKTASRGAVFAANRAVLHLGADGDGWKIDLPSGYEQRFACGYDESGALLPSGVYGNSANGAVTRTRYSSHFPAAGGVVRIARSGTTLILR